MPYREILNQNPLDVIIASCIGILHPDQLQMMCPADFRFLFIPPLHDFILKIAPSRPAQ